MSKVTSVKQMNGTFGSIWLEGEKFSDVDSFEAKVSIEYEDVNMSEDLATHKKMTGWAGEGTLALKKVYSTGASLLAENIKKGKTSTFSFVGKIDDPDAFGAERVAIKEVTFSEFTLMKFEQKTLLTEELPFSFAQYEPIDLVTR